jgi:hypothetical protein
MTGYKYLLEKTISFDEIILLVTKYLKPEFLIREIFHGSYKNPSMCPRASLTRTLDSLIQKIY